MTVSCKYKVLAAGWPTAAADVSQSRETLTAMKARPGRESDLPYVLTYTGEDNMMMGTDYSHHDHAADLEGLRNLKTAGGISARVYDKIVDDNPRAAYAL